jgi:hypothetical protein
MPTDSDQLVVTRYAPRRAALAIGLATLLVVVVGVAAFELGARRAGYSLLTGAAEHAAAAARERDLARRAEAAEAKLAQAELAARIDHESSAQVEKSLADLEARLAEQSQELTFYRSIVNPVDGIEGLRIERLRILPGSAPHRFRVRIVLIQAARQDAVTSASADLSVDGLRAGRAVNLPLAAIGTNPKPLNFSFRYFQEIETEIQLPADFQPQRVQVEVRPGRATAAIRQSYPWKVVNN